MVAEMSGWNITTTLFEWKMDHVLRLADCLGYISIALLLWYFVQRYQAVQTILLPLPPCPPRQGALGHVAILPKSFEYLEYGKWAKELDTDIIHLQLGKKIVVVLNSWNAITQVLERNSTIYSDRDQDTMKSKIVGWGWLLSSMPYGDRWRKGRTLFQQHLHPQNFRLFQPRQLAFIRGLLLPQLLQGPADVIPVVKHFSGGLSISVAYGIEMQARNDPYVEQSEKAMTGLVQSSMPGRWLVDIFPILQYVPAWFPGANWKRQALSWRQAQIDNRTKAFEASMKAIRGGTSKPSFLLECLQSFGDREPSFEEMELVKDISAIIYTGGADTIASVISGFILAMICYPEIQVKAREELDRVIGLGRLPTFEDKNRLPYITAIMKEGLRWQVPNPFAVPHKSTEEGTYNGYRIPKGASVIGNIWLLMQDETDYPDPTIFKPERFLNPDGSLNNDVRDPSLVVFGFGRRLCPGRHIGLSALWMSIASILSAFEIEKGLDDTGGAIQPEPRFMSGFARTPAPFRATFRVRSKEMGDLIRSLEESHL